MGGAGNASWMVGAAVGVVEALKDQGGLCRWNYAIKSVHQHAKNNLGSVSQARRRMSSSSVGRRRINGDDEEKAKRSEEALRTVMYLSCWGPN